MSTGAGHAVFPSPLYRHVFPSPHVGQVALFTTAQTFPPLGADLVVLHVMQRLLRSAIGGA